MLIVFGLLLFALLVLLLLAWFLYLRWTADLPRLEDRTSSPLLPAAATEIVADLDYPAARVTVSENGRMFVSFHPATAPPYPLAEVRGTRPEPYPPGDAEVELHSVFGIRADRQNRLWVLDNGQLGVRTPRLIAFNIYTGEARHRHEFPADVAGFLSLLTELQVDPEMRWIYIADTSPVAGTPALIVYDVERRRSRRVLEGHPTLQAEELRIEPPDGEVRVLGLPLQVGLASMALDRQGEWLYYGPMSGERLYRIRTEDLRDSSLSAEERAARIEDYGPKTITDGLATDDAGNVYMTDPEHYSVLRLTPDRQLETVVKDSPLQWPGGLSFGPDGWLYVTAGRLGRVLLRPGETERYRPYHVIRFRPGSSGFPGH